MSRLGKITARITAPIVTALAAVVLIASPASAAAAVWADPIANMYAFGTNVDVVAHVRCGVLHDPDPTHNATVTVKVTQGLAQASGSDVTDCNGYDSAVTVHMVGGLFHAGSAQAALTMNATTGETAQATQTVQLVKLW